MLMLHVYKHNMRVKCFAKLEPTTARWLKRIHQFLMSSFCLNANPRFDWSPMRCDHTYVYIYRNLNGMGFAEWCIIGS